ncbi:MAG: hypothetical protein PUC20_00805, partial [Firmicutes bacterium]|nr:hypothetical protein [Bacillota bacterium]
RLMEANQKWYERYRKELLMGFAILAALILIIGLMLAWFFGRLSASTVGRVKAPAEISIMGPNETYMEQIDLSYDKTEVKDGIVTLLRPFCVSSPSEVFDLYLAHTTNIDGLKIELYTATAVPKGTTGENVINGIDSNGVSYTWQWESNVFNDSGYLNKDNDTKDILATRELHEMTFGAYGDDKVQINAEPLYWHCEATAPDRAKEDSPYVGNFVLMLSWEEKFKETDIIYLIAKSK